MLPRILKLGAGHPDLDKVSGPGMRPVYGLSEVLNAAIDTGIDAKRTPVVTVP